MRQRRRTLKNRGYARANRRKLVSQGQDLEVVIKKRRSEMKAIAEEIKEVKLETAKLKLQIEEATKIRQEQPLLFPPLDKIKTDMEADRAGKHERDKLKLQAIIKTKLPHTLDVEVVEEIIDIRQDETLLFPSLEKIKTEIEAERDRKPERDKLKLEAILKTKLPDTLEVVEEMMQIRQEKPVLFPPLERVKTEIEVEFSTVL